MNSQLMHLVVAAQLSDRQREADKRRRVAKARKRAEHKSFSRVRGYFRHERSGQLGKLHRARA